jgi:hypothetical protein
MDDKEILITVIVLAITGLLLYKFMHPTPKPVRPMRPMEPFALSDIANTYRHSVTGNFEKIDTKDLMANHIHGGVVGMLGNSLEFSDGATMRNKGGIFNNIRNEKGQIIDVGQNKFPVKDYRNTGYIDLCTFTNSCDNGGGFAPGDNRNIEGYVMESPVNNPNPRYQILKGWY